MVVREEARRDNTAAAAGCGWRLALAGGGVEAARDTDGVEDLLVLVDGALERDVADRQRHKYGSAGGTDSGSECDHGRGRYRED